MKRILDAAWLAVAVAVLVVSGCAVVPGGSTWQTVRDNNVRRRAAGDIVRGTGISQASEDVGLSDSMWADVGKLLGWGGGYLIADALADDDKTSGGTALPSIQAGGDVTIQQVIGQGNETRQQRDEATGE